MAGRNDQTQQSGQSGQDSPEDETWRNDVRAKRAEVLHRLAERELPLAPAEPLREPLPRLSPEPRRRWPWVVSVALLVTLLGGVLAHALLTRPPTASVPPPNTIDPRALGVFCVVDVAWSPDGAKIAILGYEQGCRTWSPTSYLYYPGIITILEVREGHLHLLGMLHPDPTILATLHLPPPSNVQGNDTSKQIITYTYIAWSPDGRRLALTFRPADPFLPSFVGVFVTDLNGTQTSVLRSGRSNVPPDYGFSGRWDLQAGAPVRVPANATGVSGDDIWQLPNALGVPALGYHWTADGVLEPLTPLNSSAPPPVPAAPQPAGNPDGSAAFTIWQSGVVTFDTVPQPIGPQPNGAVPQRFIPGIPTFEAGFLAWSPDGRYLAEVDRIQYWRIAGAALPKPSAQELAAFRLASAPVLPVRDRALAALLRAIMPAASSPGQLSPTVVWSPDGKLLAVASGPKQSANGVPQTEAVTVYDYATGQPLAHLTTGSGMQILSATAFGAVLRWAKDGRHLLLFDPATDTLTTWGPSAIPQP